MAIPVPIIDCDACDRRVALCASAFAALYGHGYGYFCARCRELYGEEEAA